MYFFLFDWLSVSYTSTIRSVSHYFFECTRNELNWNGTCLETISNFASHTIYTKLGWTSEVETCTRVIIFMVSNNLHFII